MALPGIATVLGVGAAILYRALDPRAKEERLLNARDRIFKENPTPARARKLAVLDDELVRVRRAISRRAGD